MIIVVEGADNTGKTTLAVRLAHDLGGLYLKTELRPPTLDNLMDFTEVLRQCNKYTNYTVLDRHHIISEPVYGPIIRGKNPFDDDIIAQVLSQLNVIWCNPPRGVALLFDSRDQMEGVKENAEKIYDSYVKFFTSFWTSPRQFTEYDRTTRDYQSVLNEVKSWS